MEFYAPPPPEPYRKQLSCRDTAYEDRMRKLMESLPVIKTRAARLLDAAKEPTHEHERFK